MTNVTSGGVEVRRRFDRAHPSIWRNLHRGYHASPLIFFPPFVGQHHCTRSPALELARHGNAARPGVQWASLATAARLGIGRRFSRSTTAFALYQKSGRGAPLTMNSNVSLACSTEPRSCGMCSLSPPGRISGKNCSGKTPRLSGLRLLG